MNQPRILAILVNWRQPEMTVACVQALHQMSGPPTTTLIVDNGSGDHSLTYFHTHLPDTAVIAWPENVGFAAGANVGLRRALAEGFEYALIVTNDVFPAADMLTRLIAETAVDIALLAPKILYEAEPQRIWFGGGRQDPNLLELRDRGQGEWDGIAWQGSRDVDYVLGTCLLVNLTAVKTVGLLDEQFFMYYEDLDWSLRFRQAGYRLRLVGDARLYHRVAVSSGGEDSPLRRYYISRSSVQFFRRYAHLGKPKRILVYRLASATKLVAGLLVRGEWKTAVACLRGLRDGWKLASKTNKKLEFPNQRQTELP